MMKGAIRTAIVFLALGAAARGQTPVGPNFQVNSYTTGYQIAPSIGVEPDGDFVVVWSSQGQDGSDYGAFGQRFAASGAPRGGEFQINSYTTGFQGGPDVAVGSAGDFVVVWTSVQDGSLYGVQGRRYDASGNPLGGEFQVNTYTTGNQAGPRVGRAADGRFVVTWTTNGPDGDSYGISARRFDSSGNPVGDEFVVNTSTYGLQLGGDVASDGNGNFVVVWQSYEVGYPFANNLFGQQFDSAGNRVGAEFSIDSGGGDGSPSVSMSPSGTFVVAWTGLTNDYYYGYQTDVRSTAVNGTVNAQTGGDQFVNLGAIAHDGIGNFIVTWTSYPQDGSSSGVFGQRFDGAGNRLGDEFGVNTHTTGEQVRAAVGADAVGNFIVVWDGWNGPEKGVVAQRFGPQIPTADIAISVTDSPDPVPLGSNLVYTIVVTNNGPDSTSGVQVAHPTPFGLIFVSNNGACTTPFPCALGTLPPAQTRTIIATYQVPLAYGGLNILTIVTATTTTADPNPANNQAIVQTAVAPASADLSIVKLGPATVVEGSDIVYSITVNNSGPSVAAGVQVADSTPPGLTFVSNTGSCTTPFPCILGTVPDGQSHVITATFHVPGVYGGPNPIVNVATVTATTPDPNGANNADDATTTVIFSAHLEPASIAVDGTGNGVFQPNETVIVAPGWRNAGAVAASNVTGAASSFTGPAGAVYTIDDATANYGTIAPGVTVLCGLDCYSMTNSAATRPVPHWDTTFLETLSAGPFTKTWQLHIGDSFTDVLASHPFYRFVETIFHRGITAGCSATRYCPTAAMTREQMAVFVLVAKEGSGYVPPPCTTPVFNDVPASSPFCRWIEELARRGVVGGCGGGYYCPVAQVTREQMAVFVLRTLDATLSPPPCAPPNLFGDVPETSPFCRWIEELARRGVVAGCGGGNYCPTVSVTREQMSVFVSGTFGLTLYGP